MLPTSSPVPASHLASDPTCDVRVGTSPDGLPWLLRVDRRPRVRGLRGAVLTAFGLERWEQLPPKIRGLVEDELALGLFGLHTLTLPSPERSRDTWVSRKPIGKLLGRTLLSRVFDPPPSAGDEHEVPITVAAARTWPERDETAREALAASVERTIRERRSARHLVLELSEGAAWVARVEEADRALRQPTGTPRPAVFEDLAALPGAEALLRGDLEPERIPLADGQRYRAALERRLRMGEPLPPRFELPRASLVALLIEVGRLVSALHAEERVHGDLTPGNLLLEGGHPVSFDALRIKTGEIASAATFAWAPPEQIVGRPLSPRSDVYCLGKLLAHLVGGVAYGEETVHVVPTGGQSCARVQLLKCDGVFVDISDGSHTRAWQKAWQELLSRALAYDPARRPADGAAFADALEELQASHPVDGRCGFGGAFGRCVLLPDGGPAWLLDD